MTGLGKDPVTGRCDRKVGRCDRENMTPRALLSRTKNNKISIFSLDYRVMPNIGDSARVIGVKGIGGKEETL